MTQQKWHNQLLVVTGSVKDGPIVDLVADGTLIEHPQMRPDENATTWQDIAFPTQTYCSQLQ